MKRNNKMRLLLSLLGVILIGLSISFLRIADMGTDPFTTFNLGFSQFLGMRFGNFIILSNIAALVLVFFMARKFIGLGTLFNILLVGNISDMALYFFQSHIGEIDSFWFRFTASLVGIVVLAIGASLYIAADLGVAPFDALPIIIEEKTGGKISFRAARVTLDILCTVFGFLFGATVGISTIITSFFMGPLIQFFRTRFQEKLSRMETVPASTD